MDGEREDNKDKDGERGDKNGGYSSQVFFLSLVIFAPVGEPGG